MDYQSKYLKYKNKYLELKKNLNLNQTGGYNLFGLDDNVDKSGEEPKSNAPEQHNNETQDNSKKEGDACCQEKNEGQQHNNQKPENLEQVFFPQDDKQGENQDSLSFLMRPISESEDLPVPENFKKN